MAEEETRLGEMSDSELIRMMHEMAEEIEIRFMQHAGGPLRLTEEDMGRLPF